MATIFAKAEQQESTATSPILWSTATNAEKGDLATDQLLNLVYMTTRDLVDDQLDLPEDVREKLKQELLRTLTS